MCDEQFAIAREIAPTHFMGTAMNWVQHRTKDEILRARPDVLDKVEGVGHFSYANRIADSVGIEPES